MNGSLPDKFEVVLVAGGFGPNVNAKARIIVGAVAKEFLVTGDLGAVGTHVLEFDGAAGESIIALEIATPTSPAALGKGDDHRKLGLALVSMAITPRP